MTAALRLATHRRVPGSGKSARVMTVPSGNVTALGPFTFFKYIAVSRVSIERDFGAWTLILDEGRAL